MNGLVGLIGLVLVAPVIWQVPRTFWPVRLNATRTGFSGLYRRYSIQTFTGYASDVSTSSSSQTIGSISAHTSATVIGGSVSATTTVTDNRKTFKIHYTNFFLKDRTGATREVHAANVLPAVGSGHLVSVAWLVHNGKVGNAFLVYNHSTHTSWVETTQRGMKNAPRGIFLMVNKLPLVHQVLLFLGIVTIPVIVVFGAGIHMQLRFFRKHSVRPLLAVLDAKANAIAAAPAGAAAPAPPAPAGAAASMPIDQLDRFAALAREGMLTDAEWTRAKEFFLGKPPDAKAQALEHLSQLFRLYREGALTESEYNTKKWEVLARDSQPV